MLAKTLRGLSLTTPKPKESSTFRVFRQRLRSTQGISGAHSKSSLSICGFIEREAKRDVWGHVMQGVSGLDPHWDGAPEAVLGKTKSSLRGWSQQNRDAPQEPLSSGHFSPPSYSFGRYWPDIPLGGFATQTFSLWRTMTIFVIKLSPGFR